MRIADVGVVHGAGFDFIDGVQSASPATEANAVKAASLIQGKHVGTIICSGYGPLEGVEQPKSEAILMADILIAAGVDAGSIEVEERSCSTLANWVLSAEIIENLSDVEKVIGVASRTQVPRSMILGQFVAAKSTYEFVGNVPADTTKNPLGTMKDRSREFFARAMTWEFIRQHRNTPRRDLIRAYDDYKTRTGMKRFKKQAHSTLFKY
jgi:uncharacterized SAM-binding protein YcdF (DUF218 family)